MTFLFILKTHLDEIGILPFGGVVIFEVLLAFKNCSLTCMAHFHFLILGPSRASLMEVGVMYCILATHV
jgi:hypothetical protein